jgi:hypothetical protein
VTAYRPKILRLSGEAVTSPLDEAERCLCARQDAVRKLVPEDNPKYSLLVCRACGGLVTRERRQP